jgi:hypothetical protein
MLFLNNFVHQTYLEIRSVTNAAGLWPTAVTKVNNSRVINKINFRRKVVGLPGRVEEVRHGREIFTMVSAFFWRKIWWFEKCVVNSPHNKNFYFCRFMWRIEKFA